ncbi:hypothetical protein BT69DRAFT_1205243, partial [Atractiella rhizophila]
LPSKARLNKLHQQFQEENIGPQTLQYTSHKSNIYHLNDIGKIIPQEVANPLVRKHLHFYPEASSKAVKEMWQSSKWAQELDAQFLSPSVHVKGSLFFVNEAVQLEDGHYFMPFRWF